MNGSNSSGLTCSYSESWTADLTLDTYTGPTATSFPNLGGALPAPSAPAGNPSASWVPAIVALSVVGGAAGIVVLVVLAYRRRS